MDDANDQCSTSQPHNTTTNTYDFIFDPETESVSVALLTSVAWLDGTDQTNLPMLADCIDPEALDDLFAHSTDGTGQRADCTLTFQYAGYEVCVESSGNISLTPTEPSSST